MLAEFYDQLKVENANDLAIVFVSSDSDEESFEEYYASMPWVSVPFEERKLAESLGDYICYNFITAYNNDGHGEH